MWPYPLPLISASFTVTHLRAGGGAVRGTRAAQAAAEWCLVTMSGSSRYHGEVGRGAEFAVTQNPALYR
eukprot:3231818-Pleurochrysis_carterae.AAC.4